MAGKMIIWSSCGAWLFACRLRDGFRLLANRMDRGQAAIEKSRHDPGSRRRQEAGRSSAERGNSERGTRRADRMLVDLDSALTNEECPPRFLGGYRGSAAPVSAAAIFR